MWRSTRLEKAGSDKRADDLFIFELELDEAYIERILDGMSQQEQEILLGTGSRHLSIKERKKRENEGIKNLVKEGKINPDNYNIDDSRRTDHLLIIPRDDSKDVLDISLKIFSLFDFESIRS